MNNSDRYLQRATWHDYTSRCSYLVTLRSNTQIGPLSQIIAKKTSIDFKARYRPTKAGLQAMTAVRNINVNFSWVDVMRYCIMPDHVHLLLYVKENTDVHLGKIINKFEIECTQNLKAVFPEHGDISFFQSGYNDKIVYKAGTLKRFKRYVEDNPLRYALRREHPEFFNRLQNVCIDGDYFTVYGNFFLLRHPMISNVRVSRSFTEKEISDMRKEWDETIRAQGVLVSPFYNPKEKEIRDMGIESGARIIKVVENGLPERFKPSGRDFDLCCEGRLLIIAPAVHQTRKVVLSRDMCQYGNKIAKKIADGALSMNLIGGRKKL